MQLNAGWMVDCHFRIAVLRFFICKFMKTSVRSYVYRLTILSHKKKGFTPKFLMSQPFGLGGGGGGESSWSNPIRNVLICGTLATAPKC